VVFTWGSYVEGKMHEIRNNTKDPKQVEMAVQTMLKQLLGEVMPSEHIPKDGDYVASHSPMGG
jgi:hypothetical protein